MTRFEMRWNPANRERTLLCEKSQRRKGDLFRVVVDVGHVAEKKEEQNK